MNSRFSSVLVAALALSFTAGCIAPSHAVPLAAGANQYKVAEGSNRLNLSEEQKNQMHTIRQREEQQIKGILNPDQLNQLSNAISGGQKFWQALHSITPTLNQDQKNRIHQFKKQARQAKFNVLRPEQQAQLQQMRAQRSSQHQQQ